jgi:hypothetical protein
MVSTATGVNPRSASGIALSDPGCGCRPCRRARGDTPPPPGSKPAHRTGPRCRICKRYRIAGGGLDVCIWHVKDAIGVTYQQLIYWTNRGYLHPDRPPYPGRGKTLSWPPAELEAARIMGRLFNQAGLTLPRAAAIARTSDTLIELAPGITLEITR